MCENTFENIKWKGGGATFCSICDAKYMGSLLSPVVFCMGECAGRGRVSVDSSVGGPARDLSSKNFFFFERVRRPVKELYLGLLLPLNC